MYFSIQGMNKYCVKIIVLGFFAWLMLNASLHSAAADKIGPANTHMENSIFDQTHRFISNRLIKTVLWFDEFFSDKRILEEQPARSSVKISNDFRLEGGEHLSHRIFFHINIRLEKLPAKISLLFIGENKDQPTDPLPSHIIKPGYEKVESDKIIFSGARYNFVNTLHSKYFIESGLKLNLPLDPYLKTRYRQRFPLSSIYYIQFAETVIWKKLSGWKTTTELDFAYLITEKIILQLNNAASYPNPDKGIDFGHVIDFRFKVSDKTAISYNMGLSGITRPESVISSYKISCKLRKRFYRDWLYYELEPENIWVRNIDGKYKSKAAITLRLEIRFGN